MIPLPPLLTASCYHTCFIYYQSAIHSHSPTDSHPLLLFKYGGAYDDKNDNKFKPHGLEKMVEVLDLEMKKEWKAVKLIFADPSLNDYLLVSTCWTAILATSSAKDAFLVYGGFN